MVNPVIFPQQVREWCRIDDTAEDALLETLIATAQEQAEAYTGKVFLPMECPVSVKQAIAIFVADLYTNREGKTVGEATFYRILSPYRVSVL
ncbi:head-tail connector protein [Sphingomonas aerophila]|uniref:Phage gp6-like head-tail connector protein n=1 Tax=Sphingomonas aerophila TaxID=1344948 RepID=A0A7W9EWS9_9SPHN|nr:head-tail connector protein [Sphingomonas aerophila]MBB5715853.1 hypothetical protein [Sphingomonas aerophila]